MKALVEKEEDMILRKKTIKSFIDVFVLTELTKKPMNGYEMIVAFQEKFDIIISSGTIYAHLYALERDKMISADQIEGTRNYKLTEKGAKHLQMSLEIIKETLYAIELYLVS